MLKLCIPHDTLFFTAQAAKAAGGDAAIQTNKAKGNNPTKGKGNEGKRPSTTEGEDDRSLKYYRQVYVFVFHVKGSTQKQPPKNKKAKGK